MSENKAIDQAQAALDRIASDISTILSRWEAESGLEISHINLHRIDVTTNVDEHRKTMLRVKLVSVIESESRQ